MQTTLVHLTSPLDIFICENINGKGGEQNVIFKSKHVRVCYETKCVWHSEPSEHPVPIHTFIQMAGKNIPCSATVLYWLISYSAEQMSVLTSLLASSRNTLIWRNVLWQTRETLTILDVWVCSERGRWDRWQIRSCQSHYPLEQAANFTQVFPPLLVNPEGFLHATGLVWTKLHSLPYYVMRGWQCDELFTLISAVAWLPHALLLCPYLFFGESTSASTPVWSTCHR